MKIYSAISRLMKEAWKIDKKYFLYLGLLSILQTIISLVTMYLPATVISYIEAKREFNDILIVIVVFITGIYLLKQILAAVNLMYQKASNYQAEMLEVELSVKTMNLSYDNLENTKALDLIQRAKMPISWGYINGTLDSIQNIITGVFTVFGLLILLINHSFAYTSIIIILLFISTVMTINMQKKHDKLVQENVPANRKYSYFIDTALAANNQKEYRLYGINKIWSAKIDEFKDIIFGWVKNLYGVSLKLEIFRTIITSFITFLAIAYNGSRIFSTIFGSIIGIGTFTLIYNSTNKLMTVVQDISKSVSMLNTANAHLTPWKEYIELSDFKNTGNKEAKILESLEFVNVSFKYPNTDKIILDNISFKIDKGQKISIVGLNNAGKSTIVKLIARFYEPDKGNILWNGIDIKEYDINSYIEQISAVFQDFKLMPYTIFENIMPDSNDREKGKKSLEDVNMLKEIEKLPKKMDTYLDKELEEDATNFSGGQSQKLAIARAINKGGSLMIMDEPTAALDPIAESEIFEKFAELTKDKTSIFISHRMSSSTFSDKVLVIDGGKIVAFDHHTNLMKGHNLYRELFETQAKNYI